jgi:hypothetical protein
MNEIHIFYLMWLVANVVAFEISQMHQVVFQIEMAI